jgi:uncharacterized membrane protein YcaP (DUF421 family)
MDSVLRGAAVYLFVWAIFRAAGKRSLNEMTTFDFVLLLIISETTQAGLVGNDNSLTNTFLLVTTMLGLDIALSLVKRHWPSADKVLESVPLVILADGVPLADRLRRSRVDEEDILAAARKLRGLERLEQIKYAVLERNGGITIVPRD